MAVNQLGVLEGFYGEPWSWGQRADYAGFLKKQGFSFYIYAPKADGYLRKKWREPFPKVLEEKLAKLSGQCHAAGIEFGVQEDYGVGIRVAMQHRINEGLIVAVDLLAGVAVLDTRLAVPLLGSGGGLEGGLRPALSAASGPGGRGDRRRPAAASVAGRARRRQG